MTTLEASLQLLCHGMQISAITIQPFRWVLGLFTALQTINLTILVTILVV